MPVGTTQLDGIIKPKQQTQRKLGHEIWLQFFWDIILFETSETVKKLDGDSVFGCKCSVRAEKVRFRCRCANSLCKPAGGIFVCGVVWIGVFNEELITRAFMCSHKKRAGHTDSKARPILDAVIFVEVVCKLF